MQGYIKLYRQIVEWEWYNDINTTRLFIHLLLTANHREQKWQGITVLPGQKITSYPHLALENTLSVQAIRTSINKLKSTGEITVKSTSKYSLITIQNWIDYQQDNTPVNSQATGEQQSSNRRATTNKNVKNDNNVKNDKKESKHFVQPSLEELKTFIQENNYQVNAEQWFNYYQSNGWKVGRNPMKDWKATVRTWVQRSNFNQPKKIISI